MYFEFGIEPMTLGESWLLFCILWLGEENCEGYWLSSAARTIQRIRITMFRHNQITYPSQRAALLIDHKTKRTSMQQSIRISFTLGQQGGRISMCIPVCLLDVYMFVCVCGVRRPDGWNN